MKNKLWKLLGLSSLVLCVSMILVICVRLIMCYAFPNYDRALELPFWGSIFAGMMTLITVPLSNYLTLLSTEGREDRLLAAQRNEEWLNSISDLFFSFYSDINKFYGGIMSDKSLGYSIETCKWHIKEEEGKKDGSDNKQLDELKAKLNKLKDERDKLNKEINCSVAVDAMAKMRCKLQDVQEAVPLLDKMIEVKNAAYSKLAQDFFDDLAELERIHMEFRHAYMDKMKQSK